MIKLRSASSLRTLWNIIHGLQLVVTHQGSTLGRQLSYSARAYMMRVTQPCHRHYIPFSREFCKRPGAMTTHYAFLY
ncbi:hypothetical protein CY34DRAFT_538321 [Suillus luteus UH-Slu-Lm8-n1]|uniref:Uncharacterized protein n=1 Tax=Suillus luteus UH-Slu-Lm8-n1 TaxID=930992 RepID=A0A0D0A364_9AGAM|nr:hypothetical protein CY34DRAFT_538321 [Suillus luteus UH-Slu-Lm8-n1]